jgi:hypothetical protein
VSTDSSGDKRRNGAVRDKSAGKNVKAIANEIRFIHVGKYSYANCAMILSLKVAFDSFNEALKKNFLFHGIPQPKCSPKVQTCLFWKFTISTTTALHPVFFIFIESKSMTDLNLYTELSSLPADLKKEVQDFILFLKSKNKKQENAGRRKFGLAKGFFKIEEGFDDPLDDFKEYM